MVLNEELKIWSPLIQFGNYVPKVSSALSILSDKQYGNHNVKGPNFLLFFPLKCHNVHKQKQWWLNVTCEEIFLSDSLIQACHKTEWICWSHRG